MNMPEPMAQTTYDEINSELHNAYVGTAQESMEKAAHEICDLESQKLDDTASTTDIDSVLDTKVSGDGAWQKRGYSSLNGVVTLIGNGKCIDYEVLSKKCKSCEAWEYKRAIDIVGYNDWEAEHVCSIKHTGSAGAMEVVGIQKMFGRSVNLHGLRYTFYIGDDDTKSFDHICKSDPYPADTIAKGERVGHVEKGVGSRLRNVKSQYKGKKLSDNKGIGGGKGPLTNKVMNILQNDYGMTIHQNIHNLYAMRKAVAAVLHHSIKNDDLHKRHQYCPRTTDSWCK